MNKRETAILSFKVLSFYAFIEAIGKFSDSVYFILNGIRDKSFVANFLFTLVPPILLILCGILLWFIAPSLATKIFKPSFQEDKTEMSLVDIPIIAFSVVGISLLASALPPLASLIFVLYTVAAGEMELRQILINDVIVVLLRFILGSWLLFDSRSIVNYVYRKNKKENAS